MNESIRPRLLRWGFNLFPAYRRTGARITYIAGDFGQVRIKLPLNWKTRNYVGTIFGGSMYGAIDPIYMIMLIKLLEPKYIVWDKAATIRFRKPGRTTLYARFTVAKQEIAAIRRELSHEPSLERTYHVDLVDSEGVVHVSFEKNIYIRRKASIKKAYENKDKTLVTAT